jgi:hypothetical protein
VTNPSKIHDQQTQLVKFQLFKINNPKSVFRNQQKNQKGPGVLSSSGYLQFFLLEKQHLLTNGLFESAALQLHRVLVRLSTPTAAALATAVALVKKPTP